MLSLKVLFLRFRVINCLTDAWTSSFFWGNLFREQSVIHLTKTWPSSSHITGGCPIEDFENLLLNRNCMVDLQILYYLFAAFAGIISWMFGEFASLSAAFKRIFSCFLLNPPRCNSTHFVNKKVGKCHQARFLSLPVIIGLIMAYILHSTLAPHAKQCRKWIIIKQMIVDQWVKCKIKKLILEHMEILYNYMHRIPKAKFSYYFWTLRFSLKTMVNTSKCTSYHVEKLFRKIYMECRKSALYHTKQNSEIIKRIS